MDKRTRFIIFSFLLLSTVISCARIEESAVVPENGTQLTFSAVWASFNGSKTQIAENATDILWSPEERINIFYGNSFSGEFVSDNMEPQAVVSFTGTLTAFTGTLDAPAPDAAFYAVYPYHEENHCDGNSVFLGLSHEQSGEAGTFTDKFFPAVARSTGLNLSFYNVCGGARFSVLTEGVKRVVFSSLDGSPMAGSLTVGFNGDGLPEISQVSDPVDSIVINAPKGGFVTGEPYFATMVPQTHAEGICVRLYTDRLRADTLLARSISVKRSVFGLLEGIDEGLEYVDCSDLPDPSTVIVFEDEEVRRVCVSHFDLDEDGELTVGEAMQATTFSNYFQNNKLITVFPEIRYFASVEKLDGAFLGCSALTSLDIPVTVTSVGASTFQNCSALEHVYIPSGVSSLGMNCFNGCTALSEVEFSEGVSSVGKYAFYGCSSLSDVVLPSSVKTIDNYAFASCTKLKTFGFSSNLQSIGAYAFVGCTALESVDLASCTSLKTIAERAFNGCTGTLDEDITIPASVTSIGSMALSPFKYVNLRCTTPPTITSDSFYGSVRMGVPEENLDSYKLTDKTSVWYPYRNYIYPDSIFSYPPRLDVLSDSEIQLNLFGLTYDFVRVLPGTYQNAKGKSVTISSAFWLGKTEITRKQWIALMNNDPSFNQSYANVPIALNCPVENVTWEDVQSFIAELKKLVSGDFRLPTEAQWEFAARGGVDPDPYTYSGSSTLVEVGWFEKNSSICLHVNGVTIQQQPHPVATLNPNKLGIYDMSGNVLEWTNDYYSNTTPSGTDPKGATANAQGYRVVKGGGFSTSLSLCAISYRGIYVKQSETSNDLGFRLAL